MKYRRKRLGNRGVALAQTGLVLTALISLVAVGVDVGRVALTATEVQNLADLSATAGAKEVIAPKGDGTSRAGADALIALNSVDGQTAESGMVNVQDGSFDFTDGTFTEGGTPSNGVRATATASVSTLLAGIFGNSTETVTKVATAAYGSLSGGQADIPLTLCDTNFPTPCTDPSCPLPSLVQVPNTTDTSGWTGFFTGTGTSNVASYFPDECESKKCKEAGDSTIPFLNMGDAINVTNGQLDPLLDCIQGCLDAGINEFVIPIIDCPNSINQAVPISGFATIQVISVHSTGSPKYVEVGAIFNASAPGPVGGGGDFGTGSVKLVN